MKRIMLFLGLLVPAASCLAIDMPPAAAEIGCTKCHAIETKIVGPAWADVSRKYKGATEFEYKEKKYPLLEGLVMKVSNGGQGHWGTMPMPANDPTGKRNDKIVELVKFVLGLSARAPETPK